MKLNHQKLYDDLVAHNLKNYKTWTEMFDKMGISRSVLNSLKLESDIRSSILIKLLNELDNDLKEYLV